MSHHQNPHTIESALKLLKEGNLRYQANKLLRPNQEPEYRQKLDINGQTPMAAMIACSDSRVAVENIFDMGFGDIFVVRAAGQVLGDDQLGSLEYAVAHLGVPIVFVLAHTKCGAITATVNGAQEKGYLATLLDKIKPIAKMVENEPKDKQVELAINKSVAYGINELRTKSETIRNAEKDGKIKICGGIYDLKTGSVYFL